MSATVGGEAVSTMRSLERAFDVLTAIEEAGSSLRLTDISVSTELHVSTVTRILGVLMRRGYVEQDGAGRYRLGPLFLTGSHGYLTTDTRTGLARPIVQSLAEITGFTASFYVQHDLSRVLTVRVDGQQPLRYQIPIGHRLPLHLGGGKVLAAALGESDLDRLLVTSTDLDHASGRRVGPEEFFADMEVIRRQGYWHAVGEREPQIESLAVRVRPTHEHQRPGMVVIAGTSGAVMNAPIERWLDELKMAVRAIEQLPG
jgi:DNA-binding IclR family transcriptional regulator